MNIEDLQQICRQLPGVTEDIKWKNDLVFSIAGKMFCVVALDQAPTPASFKVREDEFDEICGWPGFKPAPYVARYKWVWTEDINNLNKSAWEKYIRQSYELVKSKLSAKLKKLAGLE